MTVGNYVKQAIASLALTGALGLGMSDTPKYSGGRAQASQSDSSYRGYIQSYIRNLRQSYGDLMPKGRSLSFAYGGGSDSQLFSEAMELYNSVMANYMRESRQSSPKVETDPHYDFVPFQTYDGGTVYTDLNGHGQLKILKTQYGPRLQGPSKLFELIGGRALGDKFIDRMEDGQFFHNRK